MPRNKPAFPRIILASRSPYRRELLQRILPDFRVAPAEVDESRHTGEAPEDYVRRLSHAKAAAVAAASPPGSLVIGSDQAAERDGEVLGKPGDPGRAREMLAGSAGRELRFHTGLCILQAGSGEPPREHLDSTRVLFRQLTEEEIARYVAAEPALDCAGGFRCEGLGITLFESIRTDDPTALVGLPLIATTRLLRQAGVDPLSPRH